MHLIQRPPKIFFGWWIVGATVLISLYIGGVIHFGFTAVVEPIAEEFGWSYAQISLASSLRGLEMGLLAPLSGLLADRWGSRRLVFGGSILIGLGLLTLSRVSSLGTFYLAFALMAIGMSACMGTVLVTVVANWFRKKAVIAIGVMTCGFGLGGLLVPVVTLLIDILEWRTAMLTLGLGMVVIVMPLSFLLRHKPERYGYLPDGDVSSSPETSEVHTSPESVEISVPAKQALKTSAFWHIALSSMCHSFVVGAVVTHVMPFLSSIGIIRSTASLVALALPVVSICGRLGVAWTRDKLDERRIYAASFVLMAIGMLCFGYVAGGVTWLLVPFIIVFSFGWGGSVTARLTLLRKYFGRMSFGTILGFSSGVMMVGHIAGAPLAGWVFDTYGSYQGVWFGFVFLSLLGLVLMLTAPRIGNIVTGNDNPRTQ
ncbi:L-lactate transporter [subsurface metagenome]